MLEEIWDLFSMEFPKELRRSFEGQKELLTKEKRYTLRILRENGKPLGFIAYWDLDDFYFIEHIAVYPQNRKRGLGASMIKDVMALLKPVVLECELPDTDENILRIKWYESLGFTVNPYAYAQPSYIEGEKDVPLALLSTEPLGEVEFLAARDALYNKVYKVV